jgi:PTH1 family peptidyl-tRNA hydrolase
MNESGRSIRAAMDFYKLTPEDVTVFYDELDLAPFKIKVKRGGGAAGHNGIRSTIDHIGADFRRMRLGIGHPGHKDRVTGYVLGIFQERNRSACRYARCDDQQRPTGWPRVTMCVS